MIYIQYNKYSIMNARDKSGLYVIIKSFRNQKSKITSVGMPDGSINIGLSFGRALAG